MKRRIKESTARGEYVKIGKEGFCLGVLLMLYYRFGEDLKRI